MATFVCGQEVKLRFRDESWILFEQTTNTLYNSKNSLNISFESFSDSGNIKLPHFVCAIQIV